MKTVSVLLLMIAGSVIWSRPVFAQPDMGLEGHMMYCDLCLAPGAPRGGDPRSDEMPPSLMEKLELTDAQQADIKALRFSLEKDLARLHADLEVARIELHEAMTRVNPQIDEVSPIASRVNQVRSAIFQRRIEYQVAVKNLLTTEQQNLLHKGWMGGMGVMGRRVGPGLRRGQGMGPGPRGRGFRPRSTPPWRHRGTP